VIPSGISWTVERKQIFLSDDDKPKVISPAKEMSVHLEDEIVTDAGNGIEEETTSNKNQPDVGDSTEAHGIHKPRIIDTSGDVVMRSGLLLETNPGEHRARVKRAPPNTVATQKPVSVTQSTGKSATTTTPKTENKISPTKTPDTEKGSNAQDEKGTSSSPATVAVTVPACVLLAAAVLKYI
jgi:cell division septation protein DedD